MMKSDKILRVLLICLKIGLLVLVATPLVFFSYRLIEGHIHDLANIGNDDYHGGSGLYIFLSHIALLVANVVLTLVGAIGATFAKRKKSNSGKKKVIREFRFLTFAPACSQVLYLIITVVVMSVG